MASGLVNWLRRSISEHDDVNEHEDGSGQRRSSEVTGRRPSGLEMVAGGILSKWYTTSHDESEEVEQELEEMDKKKAAPLSPVLPQAEMPEIKGQSNILTEQDIERLTPELPARKVTLI